MPSRDSIPVERSSVSANVLARRPDGVASMSTSSYSSSPSWATVRPPADTKRRDGKVGSPNSSTRPSASRPRCTTAKAHSASRPLGGLGQGQVHAQAGGPRRGSRNGW